MLMKQKKARSEAVPENNFVQAGPGGGVPPVSPTAVFLEGVGLVAPTLSVEERNQWIAQAAYFRAHERGFAADQAMDDWFAAEAELDRLLAGGGRPAE